MKPFLEKTAEYIAQKYQDDISRLCIVFPNRRAGLYFKKKLGAAAGKTIWSPQIYSLSDFILSLSGFKIIDSIYLQFELYKVHMEIEGDRAQNFDEFINWGKVLLNDFDETDKYLADPVQLFSYLSDEKALSLWNPGSNGLSEFQTRYLRFYQSLKNYYDRLTSVLIEKKSVYQGLAYRNVAEQIEAIIEALPWGKIIFAGFNAFNAAEKKIIYSLESSGKALLLWDADLYYLEDEMQEAGKFIRPIYHKTDKDKFYWAEDNLKTSEKNISIIRVAQNAGQTKVAGQLLQELSDKLGSMDQTAVVLNDESLIEPMLNSVPVAAGKFNVTMGIPLKSTPMFRLIDAVFELQANILKFDRSDGKKPKIYLRDLLRLFDHPYMVRLLIRHNLTQPALDLIKSNRIFFDFEQFEEMYFKKENILKNIIHYIVKPWKANPLFILENLIGMVGELQIFFTGQESNNDSGGGRSELELEYLYYLNKIFQKLKILISEYPYIENLNSLRSIFSQLIQIRLPYYGEPLHGMQIMGMLETQALDFKNIIMLGTNEDFLPSGKSGNSFIPSGIKRKFALPTHHDSNAVYAYHFYRLIQRVENLYILYNSEPGELGGGDKSRFIAQLQYELPKFNPNLKIKEKILAIPLNSEKRDDYIEIPKTPEILMLLAGLADRGFSASALNIYRSCSLQFYFRYIAGVEEADEPEETIEASTLGSVVHDVLASFFEPLRQKRINAEDIKRMKENTESYVRKTFKNNFVNGEIDYGKNLLIVKVAIRFINNFLDSQLLFYKEITNPNGYMMIKEVEKDYSTKIIIETDKEKIIVSLTGRFDRVDEVSGELRIIDYKTGKVNPNDLKLKLWEDLLTESKLDKCFQLLYYTYIYIRGYHKSSFSMTPGIISFRSLSTGLMKITLPEDEQISESTLNSFESILKLILKDIFNPEIPFYQTAIPENCQYCGYKKICNRK